MANQIIDGIKDFTKDIKPKDVIVWTVSAFVLKKIYNFFTDESDNDSSLSGGVCDISPNNLSYEPHVYNGLADAFYAAMWVTWGDWAEDDEGAASVLMTAENDYDVQKLICAYGKRASNDPIGQYLYYDLNLFETAARYLDQYYIDLVHEDWKSKGINYVIR